MHIFFFSISKKNKAHYINNDNRDTLPDEIIIEKTKNISENLFPIENNGSDWKRNYGNSASNRFSKLKNINKDNLNNLKVAWQYNIKGEPKIDIQSNAIVAEKNFYTLI